MGWADGAWAVTCNRIGAQGVVVLNAAGNSGLSGTQLLSGASVPEVFQPRPVRYKISNLHRMLLQLRRPTVTNFRELEPSQMGQTAP